MHTVLLAFCSVQIPLVKQAAWQCSMHTAHWITAKLQGSSTFSYCSIHRIQDSCSLNKHSTKSEEPKKARDPSLCPISRESDWSITQGIPAIALPSSLTGDSHISKNILSYHRHKQHLFLPISFLPLGIPLPPILKYILGTILSLFPIPSPWMPSLPLQHWLESSHSSSLTRERVSLHNGFCSERCMAAP